VSSISWEDYSKTRFTLEYAMEVLPASTSSQSSVTFEIKSQNLKKTFFWLKSKKKLRLKEPSGDPERDFEAIKEMFEEDDPEDFRAKVVEEEEVIEAVKVTNEIEYDEEKEQSGIYGFEDEDFESEEEVKQETKKSKSKKKKRK
jgi:hypothetical protein